MLPQRAVTALVKPVKDGSLVIIVRRLHIGHVTVSHDTVWLPGSIMLLKGLNLRKNRPHKQHQHAKQRHYSGKTLLGDVV